MDHKSSRRRLQKPSQEGTLETDVQRENGDKHKQTETDRSGGEYVEFERGPDYERLSEQYSLDIEHGQAKELHRLESEFGPNQVQQWADEGMPVKAMGRPRDMAAFRNAEEGCSGEHSAESEATGQTASAMTVQARLEVSSPQDSAGREAETVAERMRGVDANETQSSERGADSHAQSIERGERDVGLLRTHSVDRSGGGEITGDTESTVRAGVDGGGKPLSGDVRAEFESKMGADFSDVRVHTSSTAANAADSIGAEAYTIGSDIAFADGNYSPGSESGRKLLAHELTHVVQQTDGRVSLLAASGSPHIALETGTCHVQPKLDVSSPDDPAEKEAERIAETVMQMNDGPEASSERDSADTADRKMTPMRERESRPVVQRRESSNGTGWLVVDESTGERYEIEQRGTIYSVNLPGHSIGVQHLGSIQNKLDMLDGSYSIERAEESGTEEQEASEDTTSESTSDSTAEAGAGDTQNGDEQVEQETVHILTTEGDRSEIPLNQARIISGNAKSIVREKNYNRLQSAMAIYEGLEEVNSGIGRPFEIASRVASMDLTRPDMEKAEKALELFEEAMEQADIQETDGGVKYINLERTWWLIQNAATPAEEVTEDIYKYRNAVTSGAERAITGLRYTRDASFFTLGALATGGAGTVKGAMLATGGATFVGEMAKFPDVAADPTEPFEPAKMTFEAFKEAAVAALVEGISGPLRKKLRASAGFISTDHGVVKSIAMRYDSISANAALELVTRVFVEMIGDVTEDFIERVANSAGNALTEAAFNWSETSWDEIMDEFAKEFNEYNPVMVVLEERVDAAIDLLGGEMPRVGEEIGEAWAGAFEELDMSDISGQLH